MKAVKFALWFFLSLVLIAAISAAVLYVIASAVPADYRPPVLAPPQRVSSAKQFYRLVTEFINNADDIKPFEMTLTQAEINEYLASVDEIVNERPGPGNDSPRKAMEEAGLAGPMFVAKDGRITLMAVSTEYKKILSVDLVFEFTDDRRLRARVSGMRVGRLPVPRPFVGSTVGKVKEHLCQEGRNVSAGKDKRGAYPSAQEVGELLAALISAVEQEPIMPVFGHDRKRQVRLVSIEAADGRIVLGFEPFGREFTARTAPDR